MRYLSLGISPCPNDTALFYGLISGHVPLPGISLRLRIEDVDTLNRLAAICSLDITKISLHAYGHLRQDYVLLRTGAALGAVVVLCWWREIPLRLNACQVCVSQCRAV